MSKCKCINNEIEIYGFFKDSDGDYFALNNVTSVVWRSDTELSVRHYGGADFYLSACDGRAFLEALNKFRETTWQYY